MERPITIDHQFLSIDDLWSVIDGSSSVQIGREALDSVNSTREYLEGKLAEENTQYYGINTGFGSLCNVKIDKGELAELQENLVRSHAVGMGDKVAEEIVRLILFLKIKSLSFGFSGVREELVEQLAKLYNAGIYGGMKTKSAFIGSDSIVELNAVTQVHMHRSLVIGPGHLEHQNPVGLNDPVDYVGRTEMRILIVHFFDGFKDFANGLVIFHLARMFLHQVIHYGVHIHIANRFGSVE